MPVTITVNGVNYNYPKLGDENWGQDATNWAIGITQLVNSIDTLIQNTIVSGIFELADASAATPALRFQNSLTTGIYRVSPDILGFSAAGVAAGQISTTGLLQWKDGTAAAPAYSFSLDPDTGAYRSGTNQYSLSTGGLEALRITSSQATNVLGALNVTGLSTLSSTLTVNASTALNGTAAITGQVTGSNGSAATPSFSFISDVDTGLFRVGANSLGLSTAGLVALTIDSSQNATFAGNVTITGDLTVDDIILDDLTATGNITLGNADTDTVAINADVISNIRPDVTNTYDLGATANRWKDIYLAGTLFSLGSIALGDGTAAAPSFSFNADTNTGMYRIGTDILGFSTAGTERLRLNATGALIVGTTPVSTTHTIYGKVSHQGNNNSGVDWEFWNFDSVGHSTIDLRAFGDPQVRFINSNDSSSFTIGKDVTDNKFKLAATGSLGGINNYLEISTGGSYLIGEVGGSQAHTIYGDAVTFNFSGTPSAIIQKSGNDAVLTLSAASTGNALLYLTGEAGSVDAYTRYGTNGGSNFWATGLDATDGSYRIANSSTLGTTDRLIIDSAGRVRFIDGTAALPSVTFQSDPDTGMYRSTSDLLVLVTGGAHRLELTTSAIIAKMPVHVQAGTAAAPTLSFEVEPTLGFFRASGSALGWSVGGSQQGQFTATGTQSSVPFLGSDGTAAAPTFSWSNDTDTGIYRGGSGIITFSTNNSDAGSVNPARKWTFGQLGDTQHHRFNGNIELARSASEGVFIDSTLSVTVANNTTATAVQYIAAENKHIVIHYSIVRGSNSETGTMHLITDGTTAFVEVENVTIGDCGVEFSADISGADVRLRYTSSNSGVAGTLKLNSIRWS